MVPAINYKLLAVDSRQKIFLQLCTERVNCTHIEILGGGSQTFSLLWCCVHTLIIVATTGCSSICGDASFRCTASLQKTIYEASAYYIILAV
jgi:hypothetical protein